MRDKPVLFSGIQPTGNLTIGNYAGAIRNWLTLQERCSCIFCLVDLHALTTRQDPAELKGRCLDFIALYLACGLDPDKSIIFAQSHNPHHTELMWILNCVSYFGKLSRMTQFKEKAGKHTKNINAGLFSYPVLMAADILLYDSDFVPVGEDQRQHVEITRDIAIRFNNLFGQTFRVPELHIPKSGAKIKNLLDPTSKMSKSHENPNTYIGLLDSGGDIRKKIKAAVSGSSGEYVADDERSGITNLMTIMYTVTGKSMEKIAAEYTGKGYAEFRMTWRKALSSFCIRFNRGSPRLERMKARCKGSSGTERKEPRRFQGRCFTGFTAASDSFPDIQKDIQRLDREEDRR